MHGTISSPAQHSPPTSCQLVAQAVGFPLQGCISFSHEVWSIQCQGFTKKHVAGVFVSTLPGLWTMYYHWLLLEETFHGEESSASRS